MVKQKEYELTYDGKEREEDIVAETMSVPLQKIKEFGKVKNSEWHNKLIFGDNLQILKHLLKLKNEGKLKNPDGTTGIKLVYIDPPFASKQDFKGSKGQKAYQDKIAGAEFLEFLRRRLILLKELLTDDGSIYVHLDYRKAHYIKILMDEIFGEQNLINEIIYGYRIQGITKSAYARKHDTILWYSRNNTNFKPEKEDVIYEAPFINTKKSDQGKFPSDLSKKQIKEIIEKIKNGLKLHRKYKKYLFWQYYNDVYVRDIWDCDYTKPIISGSKEYTGYRTQKSESLLKRIISNNSKKGDIILDCFAGAGTTGAVAEKLGRKWIMCDIGKFSIYTIQKRMLNLKEEIGNKGKKLKPKPFGLYNAGIYKDSDFLEKMKTEDYKKFVLELFQAEEKEHELKGIKMNGLLNNRPVMIFSKKYLLTKDFIDDLHNNLGKSLKDETYIIVPESRVKFHEDYIRKGDKKYVILRVPYSIIEAIKNKDFERLEQPKSEREINQNIEQIGFDFIYPPKVKFKTYKEKVKKEYILEIEEFEPIQISKKPVKFKDSKKESIAMVMIDRDYNGKYFSIDDHFFGDEIVKDNYKIDLGDKNLGDKIMIIFIDVLGNERREVVKKEDFK